MCLNSFKIIVIKQRYIYHFSMFGYFFVKQKNGNSKSHWFPPVMLPPASVSPLMKAGVEWCGSGLFPGVREEIVLATSTTLPFQSFQSPL